MSALTLSLFFIPVVSLSLYLKYGLNIAGMWEIVSLDKKTASCFNNDGNVDLAATNQTSNDVSVLLGDGTGNFGAMTSNAVSTLPIGITSADLNNDGNVDLVTANAISDDVSVLEGNGDGTFQAAVNFTVTGNFPTRIVADDLNNDGWLDLACIDQGSGDVELTHKCNVFHRSPRPLCRVFLLLG